MFEGRSVQGVENRIFGGINELASIINLKQGYALDMLDFEVDATQTIRRRDGYELVHDFGAPLNYIGSFFSEYGVQVYVAVSNNKFYEAPALSGPWVDRTNGVTLSDVPGPWIGCDLGGRFVLTNGTDEVVTFKSGLPLKTLKEASILDSPAGTTVTVTGAVGGPSLTYGVTAITARGETPIAFYGVVVNGPNPLNSTNYCTIQWNLVPGAQGYRIYKRVTNVDTYLGAVGALTNSYTDTGQATGLDVAPTVNRAYNTPLAWDTQPPAGFITVARGRAQRALAFGRGHFWCSALSDLLNWLQPNDAFDYPIYGGRNNDIVAAAPLYDYTLLCSRTNIFVYTGSTYQDFVIDKILNVGCVSHHSMVPSGDNLYFWSEFGPNSLSRVMAGQDIQSNIGMNDAIQTTVHQLSNKDQWPKIIAWNHVGTGRIAWAYPEGTASTLSKAVLYTYSGSAAWSRHTTPNIIGSVTDINRNVYLGSADGKIYLAYSGNTDNGAVITGTYETGWYDVQSFLNRQIVHLDVIMDATVGDYNIQVEVLFDFNSTGSVHQLDQNSTDGVTLVDRTLYANVHRLYVKGFGRYFKFKFTVTNSPNPPRVLGWRPEMYSKGIR